MRKIILCLLSVMMLSCAVHASTVSASEDELRQALPSDAGALLDSAPPGSGFEDGIRSILENALPLLDDALHKAMKSSAIMLSALVLCAMAGAGEGSDAALIAGVLSITAVGMLEMNALASSGKEALLEMQSFADLLLPAMAAATAASGGITASTAIYAGTALFTDILMRSMTYLLLPLLNIYVAISGAKAICGNEMLSRLADLVKWVFRSGIKTILFVFTAYLTITGLISGAADATVLKAAKLTISGVVPVVGSMISDASETVIIGAATVKNAVGVFGMLAVIAICIGPFLTIAGQYLLVKLTAAAGSALGPKPLLGLVDAISESLGFLLAMTGAAALMLLIACVCYLKVVPV
ncbi:MAG: stage III sporulation protein AE [Ruminococcaceae bacterium]|nr:stage III sporulation protein AE [Oscillospiraceae bacterium]